MAKNDKEQQKLEENNDIDKIIEAKRKRRYALRHPIRNSTDRLKKFNEETKQEAIKNAQNIRYEEVDHRELVKNAYKSASLTTKITVSAIFLVVIFFVILGILYK